MAQIERMIKKEWFMFHGVNPDGQKAGCQEDFVTFSAMRRAQFSAWSEEVRSAYEQDLDRAAAEGRNLAEEKYIHMMAYTDAEAYKSLCLRLPVYGQDHDQIALDLNKRLLTQTAALRQAHPFLARIGRPLYASGDSAFNTSIETYQLGELLTYSTHTLRLLTAHLESLEQQGISLAEEIQLRSLQVLGYPTFEAAEAALL